MCPRAAKWGLKGKVIVFPFLKAACDVIAPILRLKISSCLIGSLPHTFYWVMLRYLKFSCLVLICLVLGQACGKSGLQPDVDGDNEAPSEIALPTLIKPVFSGITTTGANVKGQVTNRGGALVTNRGICWNTSPEPTVDDYSLEATSVNGAGEFSVQLEGLMHETAYYVRAWARNQGGVAYSEEVAFTTESIQSIAFADGPMFIIGSSLASYDAEIISNGGGEVTERGICWSASEHPTVDDHKVTHGTTGEGRYRSNITGLTERTNYYLRAYAINEKGVSYGQDIAFRTIGRGNLTYTFNKADNPTAEQQAAYDRLQVAIDSAVWYVENYTSVTKHVWLNYDPGVPTADANNEGWMRFGASSDFHNIRTMLHEMNHTFGTGTTSWWWNQAISGGIYRLSNANDMLKLITGNEDAVINGDAQHWWPYGLNQNSEVTSSWDYVYNCLLIEAMRKDGMTSHSGAYIP